MNTRQRIDSPAIPDGTIKTLVAMFSFSDYASGQGEQQSLKSLKGSAEAQARLRAVFEAPRFREAGFKVLDLAPCSDAVEVLTRLKEIGALIRSRPEMNVVLVWSGHAQTFDRRLRLATPECVDPLHEASGVPADELITQCGAKMARNFCVVIDSCEAGGAFLDFAGVAASVQWSPVKPDRSFAAFYASYPFQEAKDGVYLNLMASVLDRGPSEQAEAKLREICGNFGFSDKNRLLSAQELDQGILGETLANPAKAHGVRIPGASVFGRQYLFPNPRFRPNARACLVDRHALETHFLPKARGIEFNDIDDDGWHFAGRVQATRDVLEWIASPSNSKRRIYVLTGEGGTGKSALMGRLIVLSDRDAREHIRAKGWKEDEDRAKGTVPPDDAFAAALHLRSLTAQDTVEQLAELLALNRPDSAESFIEHAEKSGKPGTLLLLDALDEAETPDAIALRVIRPLARVGWRIIVATRRSAAARGTDDLIALLASSGTVRDLDAEPQTHYDIKAYVCERLRNGNSPQLNGNPSLIESASEKIAERASGKFLYARIATSNLLRCVDEITEKTFDALLGNGQDIGDVFQQDLKMLDRAFQAHFKRIDRGATRMLTALAWAQGNGVPVRDGLWAAIANALPTPLAASALTEVKDEHIHWLLAEAGRYILEDGDGEQAVYRLFHQSLIEHFHPYSEAESGKAHAVASALDHVVGIQGGWRHANPYLLRHMAAFWAACKPQVGLHQLLLDFAFIRARLNKTGIQALLSDYDRVDEPQPLPISLVARTLSMTAHILREDPQQLIPQLLGRLPPDDETCEQLRDAARRAIVRPMLVPRPGGLRQPGALIWVIEGDKLALLSDLVGPDSSLLMSGEQDGPVKLLDVRTSVTKCESLCIGHIGVVTGVAFSPDGARLVSGGRDGTVRLWDVRTGAALDMPLPRHKGGVRCVLFSPDGTRLASVDEYGIVHLWDALKGAALGVALPHKGASSVVFSSDSARLVSVGWDGTIQWWDASTGEGRGEPLCGQEPGESVVAFSPDGALLVSGGRDGTVRLWDARTGVAQGDPLGSGHQEPITSVAFSPDGTRVGSGGREGTIQLWDTCTREALCEPLQGHEMFVTSLAFSPDGSWLVSGGRDGTVRFWDARTGEAKGEPLRGHEWVTTVNFSPNGSRLVSGGANGELRLWDARIGAMQGAQLLKDKRIRSVAFCPDGTRLVSGGVDGTVRLWDAPTGAEQGAPLRGHQGLVESVAFSRDGTRLASGGLDGTVRLWDAFTGTAQGAPLRHEICVTSVAFSPDGTQLASTGGDGGTIAVWLWDARTGAPQGVPLRGHTSAVNGVGSSVAFSPDGTRLASGDRHVRLWNARTGATLGAPLSGHVLGVTCVAFSPDGTLLVSGDGAGTVRLWDVRAGEAHGEPLRGHGLGVTSVAISPDGTQLVSGGGAGTVRLWDVRTHECQGAFKLDSSVAAVAVCGSPSHLQIAVAQTLGDLVWLDVVAQPDQPPASTNT